MRDSNDLYKRMYKLAVDYYSQGAMDIGGDFMDNLFANIKESSKRINLIFDGSLPNAAVSGRTIAEAWENSMIALICYGRPTPTQYDQNTVNPSRDLGMSMIVEKPLEHPILHRVCPGGPAQLKEYMEEVVDGTKDDLVRSPRDPTDEKWEYTYHQRLESFRTPMKEIDRFMDSLSPEEKAIYRRENHPMKEVADRYKRIVLLDQPYVRRDLKDVVIDQIEYVAERLADQFYTRQAQAITWDPAQDTGAYDPPCLQRIWWRIFPEGEKWVLNMDYDFRSRDAYKAALMNAYALAKLDEKVANRVSGLSGKEVVLGRMWDKSDSYHLYGSYNHELVNFIRRLGRTKSLDERVIDQETFEEMANG
jgi:thymidylate synthase